MLVIKEIKKESEKRVRALCELNKFTQIVHKYEVVKSAGSSFELKFNDTHFVLAGEIRAELSFPIFQFTIENDVAKLEEYWAEGVESISDAFIQNHISNGIWLTFFKRPDVNKIILPKIISDLGIDKNVKELNENTFIVGR